MTGDQSCDLANGASAHQAGRRKGNANSQLERAFNLDSHQRIEAEVCERLVVPQTVGFHSQNSADNFAHGLCDDSFLFRSRDSFDLDTPITRCAVGFLALDRSEDTLEQPALLQSTKERSPFRPIDADCGDLRSSCAQRGLENGYHFSRRKFRSALLCQKFGDALIARDVAFAAEHAPINRKCWETK